MKDFDNRDNGNPDDGNQIGILAVKKSKRLDDITCFRCGKLGHYMSMCPDKANNKKIAKVGKTFAGTW